MAGCRVRPPLIIMADLGILFRIRADSDQAKREISGLRGLVSKEIGGISNDFASAVPGVGRFAGALGPLSIGLVATAGAAIGAGVAIFGLAKQAADAGSEINDLSIKTGLSAETLSGLKLQATQSGTSIEALGGAVFLLQRNMASAADGNKELSQTFKDLGVDVKGTTDDALRQLFKSLAAIPDEGRRNAEGAKVMGRAYKELAVLFKDVDGDMDAVIERARELGQVISKEASVAADKFNDDLDQLTAQLAGVGRQIGQGLVPEINSAIVSISAALESNKSSWASWGEYIGGIIRDTIDYAVILGNVLSGDLLGAASAAGGALARQGAADFDKAHPWTEIPLSRASGPTFTPRGGGGKKGGGAKAAVVDSNQLEITRQETERFYKEQEEIVQRSYDRQLRTIEEFTDEQVQLELNRSAALKALLIEERAAITEKGEARRNKERTINEEIAALEQQTQRTIIQIRDKGAEEAEEIEKARAEKFEAARQAADDLRISRIQNAIKERQLLESTGEKEITDIRAAALQRRVELLEMELSKFRSGSSEYLKIQGDIAAAESERVGIIEDGVQRAIDARRREVEDMLRNAEAQRDARVRDEREDPTSGRSMFGDIFADLKEGGASDIVAFGGTVTDVLGGLSEQAGNFKTIMSSAFGALAQGVGQTVKNFILLGSAGGSFRKFAAEVIASVASMAAVKAVFELAEGIASLFFAPQKAAAHFLAAKIYGSIALIAGIAGRGLAGNSFAAGGAGAGVPQGGATPSRGQASAPAQGTPISEGRQGQGIPINLTVNVRRDAGSIVDVVAGDIQSDGKLRTIIRRDFGFAGT